MRRGYKKNKFSVIKIDLFKSNETVNISKLIFLISKLSIYLSSYIVCILVILGGKSNTEARMKRNLLRLADVQFFYRFRRPYKDCAPTHHMRARAWCITCIFSKSLCTDGVNQYLYSQHVLSFSSRQRHRIAEVYEGGKECQGHLCLQGIFHPK